MRGKQKIAVYLRLSIEDAAGVSKDYERQGESNSISSQRKMLLEYIRRDEELSGQEVVEFCDDGFSGTSMDRPGMQELLRQVKQSEIGCILVKDMSRFSRDYIELGTYLNQIFPFMGVRFIAVNDHYDSREHEGSTIELDTAFQTLLYDLYSKDISVKVKSSVENKCANGEYVFGQVPFGYAKSQTEKNVVVINDKEAEIVRHVFSLAESGMSSTQIARRLFEEQVPTSSQMRHPERKAAQKEHLTWSAKMVRKILNNRFYLGEMAYGKTVRKSVGSKTGVAVPREEWKVIPDHHEPLVTPEIFARVSSFRPAQSTKRKRDKHPLTGKIYCGGCGYAMIYKPESKRKIPRHFWCMKHALLQIPECCTYFRADMLEEIVLTELYRELMWRGDLAKQRESLERFQKKELQRLGREKENSQRSYHALQKEKDRLYESYALGQMKVEDYRQKAEEIALQIKEMSYKIEEIELKYNQHKEQYQCSVQDMRQIIRLSHPKGLMQEVVDVFIKKVLLYHDKRVEIEWNYMEGDS